MDEAVGRIVAALKKEGELSRTVIVFTSDNGFMQGEHRIPIGKQRVYEPSTRVPLVMRGPGIPAGLRLRQPVANIDLAPTIVAAARTRAGLPMDGRPLWPLLADPGIFWGRDLLHEGPLDEAAQTKYSALRTPRWLYVRYVTGGEELYDLLVDPNQLANLRLTRPPQRSGRTSVPASRGFESCFGADCRRGPELALAVEVDGEFVGHGEDRPGRRGSRLRRQPGCSCLGDRRARRRALGGRPAARACDRERPRARRLQGRAGDDPRRSAAGLSALVAARKTLLKLLAPGQHVV